MLSKTLKLLLIVLATVTVLVVAGFILLRTDRCTAGFHRAQTAHFDVFYQELKPSTLADVETVLEEGFERTEGFFQAPADKTKVVIYKSVDEFQMRTYGLAFAWHLQDWAVGGAVADEIYVASPENPGMSHDYESMLEILKHEYVHTQIWRLNEDADIWINEGLAVYFAGQKQELTGKIPSFETMQSQDADAFVDAGGYMFSYDYIEHLLGSYRRERILELIETGDYQGALGKTKREIYDEWVAAMSARSGKLH
jgi:hypothetical protein